MLSIYLLFVSLIKHTDVCPSVVTKGTYQLPHPPKKYILFPSSHQQPIALWGGAWLWALLPSMTERWWGISCAHNGSFYECLSAWAMSCLKAFSAPPPSFGSYILSDCSMRFPEPWKAWYEGSIEGWALNSHFSQNFDQPLNLYTHCSSFKKDTSRDQGWR